MIGKGKKDKDQKKDIIEVVLKFEKEEINFSWFSKDQLKETIRFIKNYQITEYEEGSIEWAKSLGKVIRSLTKVLYTFGKKD